MQYSEFKNLILATPVKYTVFFKNNKELKKKKTTLINSLQLSVEKEPNISIKLEVDKILNKFSRLKVGLRSVEAYKSCCAFYSVEFHDVFVENKLHKVVIFSFASSVFFLYFRHRC